MIERNSYVQLWNKLISYEKMVFISGPRQSGKTAFAKNVASSFVNSDYFNWDAIVDKRRFSSNPLFFLDINRKDSSTPLIIFDEIHKYKKWKNYLKGVYDDYSSEYRFLATGSGRLDIYKKGGDALSGRYAQISMFPFTLSELSNAGGDINEFFSNT